MLLFDLFVVLKNMEELGEGQATEEDVNQAWEAEQGQVACTIIAKGGITEGSIFSPWKLI